MAPMLMLVALAAVLAAGVPVSFALLAIGTVASLAFLGSVAQHQVYGQIYQVATNFNLAAVPLFILMGAVLERSGSAGKVFDFLKTVFRRVPGGLGIASLLLCAVFAASSGVIGAVEVLVGMMAIPAMQRAGYRRSMSCGIVCAGGSLGTIIPPSITAVVYSSVADISVGAILAGILGPGLLTVAAFIAFVIIAAILWPPRPEDGEPGAGAPAAPAWREGLLVFAPFVLLIAAVLGSIFAGIASPTESAAVGALGTILLTLYNRHLTLALLRAAIRDAAQISSMTFMIIIGGSLFSSAFLVVGGAELVERTLVPLVPDPSYFPIVCLLVVFILGFFLDWVAVVMLAIPVFYPLVKTSGIDLTLFGVLVCLVIQTSYITPPMAPSVFYLKTILPGHVPAGEIYRGLVPFLVIEIGVVLACWFFPPLATYFPQLFYT